MMPDDISPIESSGDNTSELSESLQNAKQEKSEPKAEDARTLQKTILLGIVNVLFILPVIIWIAIESTPRRYYSFDAVPKELITNIFYGYLVWWGILVLEACIFRKKIILAFNAVTAIVLPFVAYLILSMFNH